MEIKDLIRPNIRALKPYSSARSEFSGNASVFLDANENPFDNGYNRYPDPLQRKLKEQIASIKKVDSDQLFLGNGSDEAIDLIYRIFCIPGIDNVVAPEPTYGMYEVCAEINDISYRKVPFETDFKLNAAKILSAADDNTKVIFLCSPNNPTGNILAAEEVLLILDSFHGIVVIDEAYIDFSDQPSYLTRLNLYPRLIVLQTFSKAWAHASIRLGMAFASPEIIDYFNKVKYPYNINLLTQKHALQMLLAEPDVKTQVIRIKEERERLRCELSQLPFVKKIYPSDANFLLVCVDDADKLYYKLTEAGVIVRNRNRVTLCEGCLRITIGTETENTQLLNVLCLDVKN